MAYRIPEQSSAYGIYNNNKVINDAHSLCLIDKINSLKSLLNVDISFKEYKSIKSLYRSTIDMKNIQEKHGIELTCLFIVLAIGVFNVHDSVLETGFEKAPDSSSEITLQPASIKFVAELLKLNRETVRRKILELETRNVVTRLDRGFVINDWDIWNDMLLATTDQ